MLIPLKFVISLCIVLFVSSSLCSTLETTFDTTVTTEVNGRSLPALAARSSPMAWRLGQTQTPRLQAGEAPSMPSGYSAPRSSTAGATANTGRYSGHSDPSRFVTLIRKNSIYIKAPFIKSTLLKHFINL